MKGKRSRWWRLVLGLAGVEAAALVVGVVGILKHWPRPAEVAIFSSAISLLIASLLVALVGYLFFF